MVRSQKHVCTQRPHTQTRRCPEACFILSLRSQRHAERRDKAFLVWRRFAPSSNQRKATNGHELLLFSVSHAKCQWPESAAPRQCRKILQKNQTCGSPVPLTDAAAETPISPCAGIILGVNRATNESALRPLGPGYKAVLHNGCNGKRAFSHTAQSTWSPGRKRCVPKRTFGWPPGETVGRARHVLPKLAIDVLLAHVSHGQNVWLPCRSGKIANPLAFVRNLVSPSESRCRLQICLPNLVWGSFT